MPRPIPRRPIDESEVEYYTRPSRFADFLTIALFILFGIVLAMVIADHVFDAEVMTYYYAGLVS